MTDSSQQNIVSVWVVEDNPLLRATIVDVVDQEDGLSCDSSFDNCEDALLRLEDGELPDLVLMDLGLPGMSGQEGIRRMSSVSPMSLIVVLTAHEDDDLIFDAICAGASGYLLKPTSGEQLVSAIHSVLDGGAVMSSKVARKVLRMFSEMRAPQADYGLTSRENEILCLLVDGLTKSEIGEKLFVSIHTVDTHVRNIYAKMQVHSRSGAVVKAVRERLVRRKRE